jgi:hypothetical protein
MPEVFRRVVLKPPGLAADTSADLARRLEAAADAQRRLAVDSPHVLQLVGNVQEDEHAFVIEHEPARAIEAATLFQPDAPLADETFLLRLAAAIVDALRVAHEGQGHERIVHGGLCPGVILETGDGIHKIADFGVAPAICATLGVEQYVELAVATGATKETAGAVPPGTGVWEVLSPDEASRDDRLCGFIDPEKYGSQVLGTFEAGSDVIAAGILLHLLAEHRHPMLEDPDAHRLVVLAESMAFWPYNGARRASLRESTDPAVRCWCDTVAGMLARLPKDRPSARDIAVSFAQVGVKPVDASEMLRRRLETIPALIQKQQWDKARRELKEITSGETVPEDVADKADTLLQQVQANLLLADAQARLKGDDWTGAREPLDRLSALSAIPAEVADEAEKVAARLKYNLEIQSELDRAEASVTETAAIDLQRALDEVRSAVDRTERWLTDKTVLPPLRARCQQARGRLQAEAEKLVRAVQEREADLARVAQWVLQLKEAWGEERWDDVEEALRTRPDTPHWPESARSEARAFEAQFAELQKTGPWLQKLRKALDSNQLDTADRVLAEKPALTHWPPTLAREVAEVEERLRLAIAVAADRSRAEAWIRRIQQAVEGEDWPAAARELATKPPLEHWPDEVVEQEARYRPEVERRLAELERERLEIEEAKRKARAWLEEAEQAARHDRFDEAIKILNTPPLGPDRLPKEARNRAGELQRAYEQAREEARRKRQEQAVETARGLASAYVGTLVEQECPGLLARELVAVKLGPVSWRSAGTPTQGRAPVELSVQHAGAADSESPITCEFQFRLDVQPPQVRDDKGELRTTLRKALLGVVARQQAVRAEALLASWRDSLFPDAEMAAELGEPAPRARAVLHLLGRNEPSGRAELTLAWDPANATWGYAEPGAVVDPALSLVHERAREIVPPQVMAQDERLRQHASIVSVEVDPPPSFDPVRIPESLVLPCRVLIHAPGEAEPKTLLEFKATCRRIGGVEVGESLGPAARRFAQFLVEHQNQCRNELERSLKSKAKAATTRIRLVTLTKAVKTPVQEIRFELRPKRRDRVTVAARWAPNTFDFSFSEEARSKLDEVLTAPPVARTRTGRAKTMAGADRAGDATPARRRVPARAFGLTAVAAVLVLAVAIPIIQSRTRGPDSGRTQDDATQEGTDAERTPAVDDTQRLAQADRTVGPGPSADSPATVGGGETVGQQPNEVGGQPGTNEPSGVQPGGDTGPADGQPTEQGGGAEAPGDTDASEREATPSSAYPGASAGATPPSDQLRNPESALAAVRDIFAASPYLAPHLDTLIFETDRPAEDQLVATSLVPGLPEPRRLVTLSLDPDEPTPLTAEESTSLEGAAAAVTALLDGAAAAFAIVMTQDLSTAFADSPFINAGGLRVRVGPSIDWTLDTARTSWLAYGVDLSIALEVDADEPEGLEPIDLARLSVDLIVADGTVRAAQGRDPLDRIAAQIGETLLERQIQSHNSHWRQVARRVADWGAHAESEVDTLTELTSVVAINVARSRLVPRRIEFEWDPSQLIFTSQTEQDALNGLSQAAAALDELARIAPVQNDWLSRAWPDGRVPPFEELSPPQADGTWIVGCAAPWPASGDGPTQTLPMAVTLGEAGPELAQPRYWPIIERYAEFVASPRFVGSQGQLRAFVQALNQATLDVTGTELTQLTDYLDPEAPPTRVLPRAEMETGAAPTVSDWDAQAFGRGERIAPQLRIAARVTFGIQPALLPEEEVLQPLGTGFIAGLDTALADLTVAKHGFVPACTLEWALSNGDPPNIVERWTDADDVAGGLLATMAEARQLDRLLANLPVREALEQTIDTILGASDQTLLDADRAFSLLQSMWLVKGGRATAPRGVEDLSSFSEDRQRQLKRSFSRPKRRVEPSVFVEFFSGPRSTYAIVWSVKRRGPSFLGETVREGPFLIRVCGTEAFYDSSSKELSGQLGSVLFEPVFSVVPEAVAAEEAGTFGKHVALAIAHDDRLSLADLRTLSFPAQRSFLEAADLNTTLDDSEFEWSSLEDLRTSDWACDYTLLRTLSDARESFLQARTARAWAITTADQALGAAREAGP